ncbi:hypothetical protein TSUD_181560 [Trifolium subterraneum]|uniref:Uncharacterized protein n=1 Tax=Trifolium subterraneum TaxID=3900 RepID=A0A2Z6NZ83_TRISU|nr:hypothetical protein TSUD_181560 [Trifolium subterraneum]
MAKLEKKARKPILRESVFSILAEIVPLICANRETTNNLLPVSSNNSNNAPMLLEQNFLTFKAFLGSALHIPTRQRIGILVFLSGLLHYVSQISTNTLLESQSDRVSIGEAISQLTPLIAHTTLFIISYIMSWTLVLPLNPGLLIFLGVILTYAPFLVYPYLVRHSSASGILVDCGVFNLSVIGFTGAVTFAFCLFFAAVVFTVLYTLWCFMYRMKPASGQDSKVTDDMKPASGQDSKVTDALSSLVLEELNANDNI